MSTLTGHHTVGRPEAGGVVAQGNARRFDVGGGDQSLTIPGDLLQDPLPSAAVHFREIVAITAEPLPQRIASVALGTGDMDCVYHIALPELEQSVMSAGSPAAQKSLATMISGKLLRDIADLPMDLAI